MRTDVKSLLREAAAQQQEIDAVLAEAEAAGKLSPLERRAPVSSVPTATSDEKTCAPSAQDKAVFDVRVVLRPGETVDDALARVRTSPFAPGAATISDFAAKSGIKGLTPVNAVIRQLEQQAANASSGDLTHTEAMLAVQATTLDTIFNALARKAANCLESHPDATERYLRMALKAQGQCRATVETLAAVKFGPVVFARQANINNGGQQQVNNGGAAAAPASRPRTRARGKKGHGGANELLESGGHGQRLDT